MSRNYLPVPVCVFVSQQVFKARSSDTARERMRRGELANRATTFSTRTSCALLTCPSKSVKLPATRAKLRSPSPPPSSRRFFLAHFLPLVVASFFPQHPAGRTRSKIACARYAPKSTSDNAAAAYGSCSSRLCARARVCVHVHVRMRLGWEFYGFSPGTRLNLSNYDFRRITY